MFGSTRLWQMLARRPVNSGRQRYQRKEDINFPRAIIQVKQSFQSQDKAAKTNKWLKLTVVKDRDDTEKPRCYQAFVEGHKVLQNTGF
ncbi:hypothetical protein ACROYT_G034708 [Oculina patagonica]